MAHKILSFNSYARMRYIFFYCLANFWFNAHRFDKKLWFREYIKWKDEMNIFHIALFLSLSKDEEAD